MEEKQYEIGGAIYHQRELVLGQWEQIAEMLNGISLSERTVLGIVQEISDAGMMDRLMSILLIPDGVRIQDKDLDAIGEALRWAITSDQIAEALNDFFDCNPIRSILSRVGSLAARATEMFLSLVRGPNESSSSFAGETSPEATSSDGGSPRETQAPGSNTSPGSTSTGRASSGSAVDSGSGSGNPETPGA